MNIPVLCIAFWLLLMSGSSSLPSFSGLRLDDREISAHAVICRFSCISSCLGRTVHERHDLIGDQALEECKRTCPVIVTTDCENRRCFSATCMKFGEPTGSSESLEKIRRKFGHLEVQKSLTTLTINWTLPLEIFPESLGPLLYFVEERDEDDWIAPKLAAILTKPSVMLIRQCDDHRYRFTAVNSDGLASTSPEHFFRASDETKLPPIGSCVLRELQLKNDVVSGLLSWNLPPGITGPDIERHPLQVTTTYCDALAPSQPELVAVAGTQTATTTNLRMNCSYEFKISYRTTCGEQSPDTSIRTTIVCQYVLGSSCYRTLPVSPAPNPAESGSGIEPDMATVLQVNVLYDATQTWAVVTWMPPKNLGSSKRLLGYEIWWAEARKPVDGAGWYYDFVDGAPVNVQNITSSQISGYKLHGLKNGTTYGIKIAAIGDVWYNVSQVLRYKRAEPFFTGGDSIYVPDLSELKKEKRAMKSTILAIVLPIIASLFLVASLIFVYRRYKQRKLPRRLIKKDPVVTSSEPLSLRYKIWHEVPAAPESDKNAMPPRTPDRWELPRSRISLGEVIGKGAFGEVFKGTIHGTILVNSAVDTLSKMKSAVEKHNNYTVAVKVLPVLAGAGEKESFLKEIQTMKDIGYHRHVVSLIGCCVAADPIYLIEEYCPLGDLRQYLCSKRQAVVSYSATDSGIDDTATISTITLSDLLSYGRQIAIGMEFIHRKGYVHRDLAARNILLVDRSLVKIGDFGLTRYVYEDSVYVMQNAGKLPVKWMAVEAIFDLTFTAASDVWAFGVILFELITLGGNPYPTICNKDLLTALKNGYRMECPDNCPPDLYALMLRCWQLDPSTRPSFTEAQADVERMLEASAGTESYLQLDTSKDYYFSITSEETATTTK